MIHDDGAETRGEMVNFDELTKDAQILMRKVVSFGLAHQRISIKNHADYQSYLKTQTWQSKRKAALKRAGHRCNKCGATRRLEVHHKTYSHLGFERPSDLVVLCRECHESEDR